MPNNALLSQHCLMSFWRETHIKISRKLRCPIGNINHVIFCNIHGTYFELPNNQYYCYWFTVLKWLKEWWSWIINFYLTFKICQSHRLFLLCWNYKSCYEYEFISIWYSAVYLCTNIKRLIFIYRAGTILLFFTNEYLWEQTAHDDKGLLHETDIALNSFDSYKKNSRDVSWNIFNDFPNISACYIYNY